jgi:NAD-dependent deacetylase
MEHLEQAREWLAQATSLAVLTGAGISSESGVPTFRGGGGLWKDYNPEELATPHRALVELEKRKPRFTLITQNVDGLHDRAGSGKILKLHGDIWRMRCTACGANWPDRRAPLPKLPPHCQCGGLARPHVVWFGEPLAEGMLKEAEHAAGEAQVFLAIGTSGQVMPAAGLIPYARQAGAKVIEINTEDTAASGSVDCALRGLAGEILPRLL